jgi:signal transduction histidine kinase
MRALLRTLMRDLGLALCLALSLCVSSADAREFGSREEAVAMVKRVQEMFAREGAEATFRAVSDHAYAPFHDRDLYPFVYDLNGINVAHGARPSLIGKNLYNLKDQDGVYLIQEMIQSAKTNGAGWVLYKWPNSLTNQIEDKLSYFELMGDYFVGVGVSIRANSPTSGAAPAAERK